MSVTNSDTSCQVHSAAGNTSKVNEGKHSERPLSPVLSNSNTYRKMLYDRKRDRSKSKVKLRKKFVEQQNNFVQSNKDIFKEESHINEIFSDLKDLSCASTEDRLKKIKEFESEKKKFSECLYQNNNSEAQTVTNHLDDFTFKKPSSPISGTKKGKQCAGILVHDRKTTTLNSELNLSNVNKLVKKDSKVEPNVILQNEKLQMTDLKFKGFCTGSGKNIAVSPESIKKHSEIFNDILNTKDIKLDSDLDHNFLKGRSVLNNNGLIKSDKNTEFSQSESVNGKFCNINKDKEGTVVEESELKDVLFMHPSISDTQINLAVDIAMSMMDIPNDDWAVSNISSNFENNFNPKGKVDDKKVLPIISSTLEYEIKELEKVLNADIILSTEIVHRNKIKSSNFEILNKQEVQNKEPEKTDSQFEADLDGFLDLNNTQEVNYSSQRNKHLNEQIVNTETLDDEENFKGFEISEITFARDLFQMRTEVVNNLSLFKRDGSTTTTDNEQSTTENQHQILKHKANDLYETDSKKFKCDHSNDLGSVNPINHKNLSGFNELVDRDKLDACSVSTITDTHTVKVIEKSNNVTPNCVSFPTGGFTSASGKAIKMSESSLPKVKHIYKQVCQMDDLLGANGIATKKTKGKETIQPVGFSTAGGRSIKISDKALLKAEAVFLEEHSNLLVANDFNAFKEIVTKTQPDLTVANIYPMGFSTAGGKNIQLSDKALNKAKTLFADENLDIQTAGGKNINISENALEKANNLFNAEDVIFPAKNERNTIVTDALSTNQKKIAALKKVEDQFKSKSVQQASAGGFSTANGKCIKISETTLQKARAVFGDEDVFSCLENQVDTAFVTSSKTENVLQKTCKTNLLEQKSMSTGSSLNPRKLFSELSTSATRNSNLNLSESKHQLPDATASPARGSSAKKRLGISSCKQITVSNDKLQKAKLLFNDFEENNQMVESNNTNINTPAKLNQPGFYSSTPLKETNSYKHAAHETSKMVETLKASSLANLNITPVKRPQFVDSRKRNEVEVENKNSPIIMQNCTEGNVENWLEKITKEYEHLEQRLEIIAERKTALESQNKLLNCNDSAHKRQVMGVLLRKKQSLQRVSLKQFVEGRKPGNTVNVHVPLQILDLTLKNAEEIHFNCNWQENNRRSVIQSEDGAIVIPNANNLVGLAEIQASFKTMPGVDSKLLPNGWISNHFKWIVWKLASMERSFPDVFAGYLSAENVMLQLKYRYDREIDRAERSALHRILEKDDIPQKRMVLFVADIIKVTSVFELELTDGWYSIRTVIDQQLCRQIYMSKVVVGTKLIVQCAEIINCEGCHPLEVPDNVRLKINYNCTRRAAWHSKLGYQRIAEPFPIFLKTIYPDGGLIGRIKIYIARVYPLKYMERQGGRTVWRNNKANEKRAQEWEIQRMKEVETIHQKIRAEYEKDMNGMQKNNVQDKIDVNTISEITSPKLLYDLLENANDLESFQSKLSRSQITSAMEYKRNICARQQQDLSSKISEEVKKLNCTQRDVCSVLRLRIIDADELSNRGFNFNIWKPTEEHLQTLKEGCTFSVFNVVPRLNGDLASTAKTHFRLEPTSSKDTKYQRQVLPISVIHQSVTKPLFNEYDTIGTIVQILKTVCYQEMWLTDLNGNLLLVKILEGSDRCSLFDNLNRGQSVALMNLMYCEFLENFEQAVANQTTVITSFPQNKSLQNSLESHCEQLPKDLAMLLNDCDKKIEIYRTKAKAMKTSVSLSSISALVDSTTAPSYGDVFDDSSEDNTLIPSRLTTTDVAMSLIDTDQYFENI